MAKKETAPEGATSRPPQAPDKKVRKLRDDLITYDVGQLEDFISTVFHSPNEQGEHILAHANIKAPKGLSEDMSELIGKLRATQGERMAMPCYFGTSTVELTDGEVRNKKAAFKRYHVVVLDDIGTKIPWHKIPEGLDPTYKIETSKGNFQLGFVLETPIESYKVASDLCSYVKHSGLTDKGGIMPCKKVRLPCGVNGKKNSDKELFPIKLHDMDGPYWNPQSLLKAMGVVIDWEKVEREGIAKEDRSRMFGATEWSSIRINHFNAEGVFDPVVEWLDEQGLILEHSTDDWITIRCPWYEGHTEQNEITAGYQPIGYGDRPAKRWFNCFHDNCEHRTTDEFLQHIRDEDGPSVPVEEVMAEFCARHVYDMTTKAGMVYDIRSMPIEPVPFNNLKRKYPQQKILSGFTAAGLPKYTKAHPLDLWTVLPTCVIVHGVTYDPTSVSPIVRQGDKLRVNDFTMPYYPAMEYDEELIRPFKQHIEYLIPDSEEHEYFLKWLAAKVQSREFRGPAIIMTTPTEGIGRNMMMDAISVMFGKHNTTPVELAKFKDATFNEHMASLFVVIDETLAAEDNEGKLRSKMYETLKTSVDPRPQQVIVNTKYGNKAAVTTAASFLFFSNHADAMKLSDGSRRMFVIDNPTKRRTPAEYEEFNNYIKDAAKINWMPHVWNWLMSIDVDLTKMASPPPQTGSFKRMQKASRSRIDIVVEAAIEVVREHTELIPTTLLVQSIYGGYFQLGDNVTEYTIKKIIEHKTLSLYEVHEEFTSKIRIGEDNAWGKPQALTVRTCEPQLIDRCLHCIDEVRPYKKFFHATGDADFATMIQAKVMEMES